MNDNPYKSPDQAGDYRRVIIWFARAMCWVGVGQSVFVLAMDAFILYTDGLGLRWPSSIAIASAGLWMLLFQRWCKREPSAIKLDWYALFVLGTGLAVTAIALASHFNVF